MPKKVFVSGCFNLLHSGHIQFLRDAAKFGDVYVALGSDRTVYELKGRPPVTPEQERLFMLKSVSFVKDAFISRSPGILDFLPELNTVHPDIFVVNEDGNTSDKK
jgi:cytidyltransferase-like protein